MTDDNTARYRSNEPFSSRPTGPDGQGSDPLAELARLIGQNDQFAGLGREARAASPHDVPQYSEPAPQPELPYGDRPYEDRSYADRAPSEPRFEAPYAPQPAAEWHHPSDPPSYDPFVPAAHRVPAEEPAHASRDHHQDAPSEPRAFQFEIPPPPAPSHRAPFDAASLEAGLSRHEPSFQPPMPGHSDPMLPPPADEFYDDAPQGGRRKGLVTVVAVLCLAVLGTGAAFGYRTWFGSPAVKSPPPVIRASAEPSKVAPPPAADPSANKISYDRFGDRGQNEQVVLREEKPVDVRDATRSGPARPMTPGAFNPASAAGTPAAAPPGANPPSVLTEPKRVRTVPIRPDMPDTAAATRPQAIAQAVPPPRQTAANAPLDLANPATPPAPVRAAAPRAAPQAQSVPPASSGNAPLSLNPDAGPPPAAARAAPTRVASAPAVSAPAASGNGSYLVQVSSQRSEADAQAAFRSVKSKYSNVIGDRQPVIRRADLAGKGTYYRAMVGPFASRDQAIQLCSSLKAAGGDCVVQAN